MYKKQFTLAMGVSSAMALLTGCKNFSDTPLPVSAYNQQVPIVVSNQQSDYPLHDAVSHNDLKTVNKLLATGDKYSILKLNEKGKTPSQIAAEKGYTRILYTLLKYGSDIPSIKQDYGLFCKVIQQPYTDPETNYQLMRQAIANKCTEVVYFLFRNGAMSYMESEKGYDLLYQAIERDHCKAFILFLNQVPTLHPNRIVDADGNTLLHLAAEEGALDIVWWLLKNHSKIKPNQYNVKGQTPLELTIREEDGLVVINKPVAFALTCCGASASMIKDRVRRQGVTKTNPLHLTPTPPISRVSSSRPIALGK